MNPKVSVIMPVHNAEKYIVESIESILHQSFEDYEFLIVNDGSNDDSKKIIESYNDSRIILINNGEKSGVASARNKGLEKAKGKYIALLDADDISHPLRLEKQVDLLDKHTDIGICGTWVKTYGKISCEWHYPTNSEFLRCRMLFDDPLATSSIMLRKKILDEQKINFDLEYPPAEDYDLWERLSCHYKIYNIPEILTFYRIHDNQASMQNAYLQKLSVWKVQERQLTNLNITYSDKDKEIHQKIGTWEFIESKDYILTANVWLLKLKKANSDKKIYPEPEFSKVLAERWFFICNAAIGLGLSTWSIYWNSPLRKYNEIYKQFYILIMCLIKRNDLHKSLQELYVKTRNALTNVIL